MILRGAAAGGEKGRGEERIGRGWHFLFLTDEETLKHNDYQKNGEDRKDGGKETRRMRIRGTNRGKRKREEERKGEKEANHRGEERGQWKAKRKGSVEGERGQERQQGRRSGVRLGRWKEKEGRNLFLLINSPEAGGGGARVGGAGGGGGAENTL